jgi:hypothetical protein
VVIIKNIYEDDIQSAVVQYCDIKKIPIFAIPNAQKLSFLDRKKAAISMTKLKKTGLKAGVPDLFIPIPSGKYHGMFIELKTSKGKLTSEQKEWIGKLSSNGYFAICCYSIDDALKQISYYLENLNSY